MKFFEYEYRKIFKNNNMFYRLIFLGKIFCAQVSNDLRIKVEFECFDADLYNGYDGFRVTLINKSMGIIDSINLKFAEIVESTELPNYFNKSCAPFINFDVNKGEYVWEGYQPTEKDYEEIAGVIKNYSNLFKF